MSRMRARKLFLSRKGLFFFFQAEDGIRDVAVTGVQTCALPILPVPYRTTDEQPTFQSLCDREREPPGGQPFPTALDPFVCTRYELGDFAREALDLGVTYLGVCCGAGPHHIRAVAEAAGREPPASRYSPDMSKHAFLGTNASLNPEYQGYAERL